MVEDVVIFKFPVTVIIEIHPHLLPRMYPIPPQHRRAPRRDPHARQRVRVHLVLLDQTLSFLVHVNAPVLPVVDLIVPNDRITISPDLYAGQRVAVNVIVFD